MNKKIVIFISGKGSNAKNLINYFSDNKELIISHVFSNNKHSDLNSYLLNTKVQYFLFEEKEISGKVFDELKKINPKLIILAGFLKKIPLSYLSLFEEASKLLLVLLITTFPIASKLPLILFI